MAEAAMYCPEWLLEPLAVDQRWAGKGFFMNLAGPPNRLSGKRANPKVPSDLICSDRTLMFRTVLSQPAWQKARAVALVVGLG